MTELDRTVEYSYDSLYRLTSETITEGEKVTVYTYAYDNVSNRILKTENGVATEYVYNALNQLVSDSETSYEYDLNGNLVRVIGSAQSALYEYNAENKLVKATVQNGSLVIEESYTYDYQGNRTSKSTHKSNGEFEYTKYLNDNSNLTNVLAEMGSEGSVQAYYTIGADLISQERDGNVSVYLYDGHGSVVGFTNENGKVTDTYAYDAFGNLISSTGSTENYYRYCGEQFDETTGLYYLRARYMDTSTGRFISQDTYQGDINDPISLHKYLYANANPVTYTDPSGYYSLEDVEVGTAGETILNVSYQMAIQSAMRIGMAILAAVVTIVDAVLITYIITDILLDSVSSVADGSATSADINEESKEVAVSKTKSEGTFYLYFEAKIINRITYVFLNKPLTFEEAVLQIKQHENLWALTQEAAKLVLAPFGGPAKRENKNLRKIYGPDAEKGKGNGAHNAVHYHPKDSDYEDVHIWFGFDPDAILNGKIMFVY